MSEKLLFGLSIFSNGKWEFDNSIFENYTSKYFDNDLYEYTYFCGFRLEIRRVYEEYENGFEIISNILEKLSNSIVPTSNKHDDVKRATEFFNYAISRLKNHREVVCGTGKGPIIQLTVYHICNDSKRIKQITYEE